jgi:hypothetical protein
VEVAHWIDPALPEAVAKILEERFALLGHTIQQWPTIDDIGEYSRRERQRDKQAVVIAVAAGDIGEVRGTRQTYIRTRPLMGALIPTNWPSDSHYLITVSRTSNDRAYLRQRTAFGPRTTTCPTSSTRCTAGCSRVSRGVGTSEPGVPEVFR